MARHSKFERAQRVRETEDVKRIEAAWFASLPKDEAAAFTHAVEAARARGPLPPQPDMAPGTPPRPPRPGHEPKVKEEKNPRRRSY